jgi:hypothetical protein
MQVTGIEAKKLLVVLGFNEGDHQAGRTKHFAKGFSCGRNCC